jgi:hypothetical protein
MNAANALGLWNHAARNPLAAPFAISCAVHLCLFGAYKVLPDSFLGGQGALARFLASLTFSERAEQKRFEQIKQLANQKLFEDILREQQQNEIPLTFIEVDPALTSEVPKNPKYYSTHDSVASNPDPEEDKSQPKIEGRETRIPRLADNERPQLRPDPKLVAMAQPKPAGPQPLQPYVGPKENRLQPDSRPETKSEPFPTREQLAALTHEKTPDKPDLKKPGGELPGDLAMATPHKDELPNKILGRGSPLSASPLITETSPSGGERPRTLAAATQRNPALAGRLMQQEGGVRKHGRVTVDARGSPFGAYDAAFIAAVQERWYQLLEKNPYMLDRQGKVVLDFRLRYDGRITDLAVTENSVSEMLSLICQAAVRDPAPFARWPGDMRRMIGSDSREVRFTFYYD